METVCSLMWDDETRVSFIIKIYTTFLLYLLWFSIVIPIFFSQPFNYVVSGVNSLRQIVLFLSIRAARQCI